MQKTTFNQGMLRQWLPTKLLLIMKMIVIILTACFMQVSAASVAQKLNYSKKGATLKQIFSEIRKQTGYFVVYSDANVNAAQKIDVHFVNTELRQVLETLGDAHQLSYEIDEKNITIMPKENSIMKKLSNFFTDITVRGKVVDAEGNPVPGATVKAGNKSVITGPDGSFYLSSVPENSHVEVSYIGYQTVTIKAKQEVMDIVLTISTSDLQEVVVNKGYYGQTRITSTGSVGTLKAADIAKQPISDPLTALTGRIPGVYVSQTSGIPGAYVNLNIRGRNRLANEGLDPLYVLDGVPFNSSSLAQVNSALSGGASPFTSIRPEDIESIDILKDADATAIYGSRGANGVVLITTKKGKAGKTKVTTNVYQGASTASRRLNLMNTEQYLEMRREGLKNENATPTSFQYEVNGTWPTNRYTDWQEIMIGGTANVTNANVSLSGGDDQTQFLIGTSYRRETTVFPGDFNNEIASGNMNLNHISENKRFKANLSINYSNNSNFLPQTDFSSYIYLAPNAPALYDANGQINWENNTFDNPLAYLYEQNKTKTENLVNNLVLSYQLLPGLNAKASLGYNTMRFHDNAIRYIGAEKPSNITPVSRRNSNGFNNVKSWIVEPELNYSQKVGQHSFEGLIGATFQESLRDGIVQNALGFSSDILIEDIGSATTFTGYNTYSQYKYNALFARFGYNYAGKYVLNLTGRRDGSSRFGPGKQFGNFGAVGAAWIFSKENLVADLLPFLSLGKLRVSIGRTGNDQIQDYQYLATYNSSPGYFGGSTLAPLKIGNPDYRWETIDKQELALELAFFDQRLQLTTSVYRNRTKNQLVGYSLPNMVGFPNVIANLPAVLQNGGTEIELTADLFRRSAFTWTASANISVPNSRLVSYPDFEASSYTTRFKVGEPLFMRYVYKAIGIDAQTGVYQFEDINKDGKLNSQDRYLKNTSRRFFGGVNNNFTYKGFSLDVFFQFVKQTAFPIVGSAAPGRYLSNGTNLPITFLDRWRSPEQPGMYQRYASASSNPASAAFDRYRQSDATIVDASFIRLKNISLSWQIPSSWSKCLHMQGIRLYGQGQNLATITNFKGADPETQSGVGLPGLPTLRTFTGGIEFSL